ncbi:MAG TPA: hypothetical protein VJ464_23790 [Blastocatellia bacterium]|nr:hypothetical protein [Blastocatellia bacterium]
MKTTERGLTTPSMRTTLAEALSRMFAFEKGGGIKSVLLFGWSLAVFSWFVDSLLPLGQELSQYMMNWLRGNAPAHHFSEPGMKLLLPGLVFLLTIAGLAYNAWRNAKPHIYQSIVPDLHKGLIVQLSAYSNRGPGVQSRYESAEQIRQAALKGDLDLAEIFKSNWGQLAFAVRYHAPVLRYCWIICTDGESGSSRSYAAESLIKAIVKRESGRDVACFAVELMDENDIGQAAEAVSHIYRQLRETAPELKASDLIADFTGGTAAMSGGMVLATLQEDREIEYLRRGITLATELDAAAVQAQRIIISPRTSRGMVDLFARR